VKDEWEWIFTVPANRDLFSLEVGEEKEDIRSVIESMFFCRRWIGCTQITVTLSLILSMVSELPIANRRRLILESHVSKMRRITA